MKTYQKPQFVLNSLLIDTSIASTGLADWMKEAGVSNTNITVVEYSTVS